MSLRKNFTEELKKAQHAKDTLKTATLRLVIAALKDRDIAARANDNWKGISDDEILSMLQSMIKQRRESATVYAQAGREELAERETTEIKIIETFLPAQLSEEDIEAATCAAIKDVGASGIKDMGKVMGALKAQYTGQMDFSFASGLVKKKLTDMSH